MRCRWSMIFAGFITALPLPRASEAQEAIWQPWSWSTDSVHSTTLGETVELRIALPFGYSRQGGESVRYPVAIVVGADDRMAFAALLTNLRLLDGSYGSPVPSLIVVGVVPSPAIARVAHHPTPIGGMARLRPSPGGAQPYGQFLSAELLPWLRERYRTLPYTVIAGHGGPGRFVVHAFANFPESFQAAVAVSPSFLWLSADTNDDELNRVYAERIAGRDQPGRLFITVGGYDPLPHRTGVRRLEAELSARKPPEVEVRFERLPADHHQTTRQQGYIDGFRWVFEPVSLSRNRIYAMAGLAQDVDTAGIRRAYEDARRSYAAGARALGLPEALPWSYLETMTRIGAGIDGRGAPSPIARTLCEDYVAWYPGKLPAHECLGDALLRDGDSLAARAHYETALELARSHGMSSTATALEEKIAEVDAALARARRP